jgi:hypothetical protein
MTNLLMYDINNIDGIHSEACPEVQEIVSLDQL